MLLKGAGGGLLGIAYTLHQQDSNPMAVAACAGTGALLLISGFAVFTSVPRGSKEELDKQTKFISGTARWEKGKDEEGKSVSIYHSEKAVFGLPFHPIDTERVLTGDGLVKSFSRSVKTTYDVFFEGTAAFDAQPCMGRCVKQHTFKDAMIGGKPNPKPAIVDTLAEWSFVNYKEMKQQARAFGYGLRKNHGIAVRDKVAVWADNSVEWMLTDVACAAYNWTSVSVYPILGPDAASFIIADSCSSALVCDTKSMGKVPAALEDPQYKNSAGRNLKVVVHMGDADAAAKTKLEAMGLAVVSFDDLVQANLGSAKDRTNDTPPEAEDLVTIMYTSGTTGNPKGVMLQHSNIVSCLSGVLAAFPVYSSDVYLSYLPLAHIFERQNLLGLIASGASFSFASNGPKALLADLGVVRPTIFAGVPKVYENIRDAVKRKMVGFKKTLFDAAVGAKVADIQTGCGYSRLWDILVFSKLKMAMGGRVSRCITGGAPVSKDTMEFVQSAFGAIVQGYGATETSAGGSLTRYNDLSMGSVGPPMPCSTVRLVDVPDMNYFSGPREGYTDAKTIKVFEEGKAKSGGEIWIGGPNVSVGYFDPSDPKYCTKKGVPSNGMKKKTDEDFFEEDGVLWFKTGDIGYWTETGGLKIVDRRKNLFKTSLGEYVPVEEVEKVFQEASPLADFVYLPKETKVPYISVCVVVSDSVAQLMKWAKDAGVEGDAAAVAQSAVFREKLAKDFAEGAKGKKLPRFMWVTKEHIHAEFQEIGYQERWVEGIKCASGHVEQLLTATLKSRRSQLNEYFAPVFAKIYADRPSDHVLP
eukprot:CAMPEP_0204368910 /NCGR_PEP_ID=MMETSP0469-20131031/44559_1 /ASSEMBLY_ACC=CAM_ASM_000384 /TAXON_ID=2969 /ORGANISM="Oxyrrhis marina" /LENGTH=808 /DNA_ID=CAMNT_0051358551 /DNA_START=33 /DNA_END=2459 /DNA_ORIENTATION=-